MLDPLLSVLVLMVRPAGVWLAGVVMAADLAANWLVWWVTAPGYRARFLPVTGLVPITVFGVFVLITFGPAGRSLVRAAAEGGTGTA